MLAVALAWALRGRPSAAARIADAEPNPRRYLSLVERAAATVDVPVIAGLNDWSAGWRRG